MVAPFAKRLLLLAAACLPGIVPAQSTEGAAQAPVMLAEAAISEVKAIADPVRTPRVITQDSSLAHSPAMLGVPLTLMLAFGAFIYWRAHRTPAENPIAQRLAPRAQGTAKMAAPRAPSGSYPKAPVAKAARTIPPLNEPAPDKPRARITKPADLELLVWDASPVATGPVTLSKPGVDPKQAAVSDPVAARIRDRYMAARFPGAVRNAADLADARHVIKAARLYFEDGLLSRSRELLDLAIEEHPEAESVWLAALEIAFLAQDADRFVSVAHAFHNKHPESPDWEEVSRLGRRLAPMHPRFGGEQAPREFDHFGPWPHLPNWIQANWDLTGEVAGIELRARLMASAPAAPTPAALSVAA